MIRRALISVSDKRGVIELARALHAHGVEILSTGGTAKTLRESGVPVRDVSDYTGSPEVMDGRVKTLHPRVHGALLMRDRDDDRAALEALGGAPIDLVCVNLYPFRETVARGAEHPEVVENIDIGGPSMLRSAAKGYGRVTVLVDPADYEAVTASLDRGGPSLDERARFAHKAFEHTASYDRAIADYFTRHLGDEERFPKTLSVAFEKAYECRYGENPHQRGAFYVDPEAAPGTLARATSLDDGGKELSYNNLVDLDAALEAVREHADRPATVIVKHTNPCGVAVSSDLASSFVAARDADQTSAFGGIIALSRECDLATATAIAEHFYECIVAPSFEANALELLKKKKALRLLATGTLLPDRGRDLYYRRIDGGIVVQDRDATAGGEVAKGKTVTKRAPSAAELAALELAWKVCKHVKSNAIVFAREDRTVGIGAGQMSRVISVEIAAQKAGENARGAVMASDAFFPFRDGLDAAAKAGIRAVAQPGGSKRDDEVIAAADEHGIAMVFTGVRHFRH
jgi:phosphoribosylaminoimidazolecarboxamide formyltransferase/IMP cyclohydrolase